MPTPALRASLVVARAAQMTADSIGAVDQQIQAAAAIHVDPVVPGFAEDFATLNNALAEWPRTLRPLTINTLTGALAEDTPVLQNWGTINQQDQNALVGFATLLQAATSNISGSLGRLGGAVAPFRTAIDNSVSRLQSDLKTLSTQLAVEQQQAATLASEVNQQMQRIQYYRDNPWQLVLDGLSIVGLINDLNTIINASNQARAALSRLQQIEPQLQQLGAARGPLLTLSVAATGLGAGVSNVQTAITQVGSSLSDILQTPPLPAILSAQLGAFVEDLTTTNGIIHEVLGGS
jgi:hypothetical protein